MSLLTLSKKYEPKTHEEHYKNVQLFINQFKNFPQFPVKVTNTFGGGIYCREMHAKANTVVISLIHKKETFAILLKGSCRVFSQEGLKIIKAPQKIVSIPGTQRVIAFSEDSIFATFHPSNGKDEKEILDEWVQGGFDSIDKRFTTGLEYEKNFTISN